MNSEIYIKKSSGKLEPYDRVKLVDSLQKAGASMFVSDDIAKDLEKKIKDGMPTSLIYSTAFKMLRKKEGRPALRYSLRRSISNLGPTGFPFEDFVGEIFKAKGFSVMNDVMVQGSCIEHEIDVVAYDDDQLVMTEVKFHNQLMLKSDLKVALYIKARFDDLKDIVFNIGGKGRSMTRGLLITNTKFTENAIKFGSCAGVNMIGWNYPAKGNLHDLIEETGLHPVTCLSTLSLAEKRTLLGKEVVTCKALVTQKQLLSDLGVSDIRMKQILNEIEIVSSPTV